MARENLIYNSFRLNMNNPQHVKINKVLKDLNPKIFKSRNQFVADAVEFYIEHYGEESFTKHKENDEIHFVTQEELEVIKKQLIQTAMTEARREVIRLLGGFISGAKDVNQESNNIAPDNNQMQQDDEIISDYALRCMNDMEGEN